MSSAIFSLLHQTHLRADTHRSRCSEKEADANFASAPDSLVSALQTDATFATRFFSSIRLFFF